MHISCKFLSHWYSWSCTRSISVEPTHRLDVAALSKQLLNNNFLWSLLGTYSSSSLSLLICLSVHLSYCPSVCHSVCQFVCPSVTMSVCPFVCLTTSFPNYFWSVQGIVFIFGVRILWFVSFPVMSVLTTLRLWPWRCDPRWLCRISCFSHRSYNYVTHNYKTLINDVIRYTANEKKQKFHSSKILAKNF